MDTFTLLSEFIKPLLWLVMLVVLVKIWRLPAVKGRYGEWRVARKGARTLPASIYRPFHDATLRDDDGGLVSTHATLERCLGAFESHA